MNRLQGKGAPFGKAPPRTNKRYHDRSIENAIVQQADSDRIARSLFGNPERTLALDRQEPGHIRGLLEAHARLSKDLRECQQRISEARYEALSEAGAVMMADGSYTQAIEYLRERGVADETITQQSIELDYKPSRERISNRLKYDFSWSSKLAAQTQEMIWFPCRNENAQNASWFARLIPPDGDRKFLQPRGIGPYPFIPSQTWERKAKLNKPLVISEGPVKACILVQAGSDSIGLGGVWNGTVRTDEKNFDSPFNLCAALTKFELLERSVYLGFDADAITNPSVRHALLRLYLALYRAGAIVRNLSWPLGEAKGVDDLLAKRCGTNADKQREELGKLLDNAIEVPELFGPENLQLLTRELKLAGLTEVQLNQLCRRFARRLQVSASMVFDEVCPKLNVSEDVSRTFEIKDDVEPWPEEVNGAKLLDELKQLVLDHVVIDQKSAFAVALWIVLTFVEEYADYMPMLTLISPVKRCGKSTLLAVLNRLVRKPCPVASMSPSSLFRTIEKSRPTLLIDETDLLLKDNEDFRLILNSGHSRDMAFAVRTNPVTLEPERFNTWAPKALAAIGKLPDTIMDRSILISMQRREKDAKIKKLRDADIEHFDRLRQQLWRWRLDHGSKLAKLRPSIPDSLNDRAGDNWFSLLAIATQISNECYLKACEAALGVTGIDDDEDGVITYVLLRLKNLFNAEKQEKKDEFLSTAGIIQVLNADEEAPWIGWDKWPKGMTSEKLARLLKPFGIKSDRPTIEVETVDEFGESKIESKKVRGFWYNDLKPLFSRYLRSIASVPPENSSNPARDDVSGSKADTYAWPGSKSDPASDQVENQTRPSVSASESDTYEASGQVQTNLGG
jgi:uncharacterized protein DUF3631/uncharacterized protein DUF3854